MISNGVNVNKFLKLKEFVLIVWVYVQLYDFYLSLTGFWPFFNLRLVTIYFRIHNHMNIWCQAKWKSYQNPVFLFASSTKSWNVCSYKKRVSVGHTRQKWKLYRNLRVYFSLFVYLMWGSLCIQRIKPAKARQSVSQPASQSVSESQPTHWKNTFLIQFSHSSSIDNDEITIEFIRRLFLIAIFNIFPFLLLNCLCVCCVCDFIQPNLVIIFITSRTTITLIQGKSEWKKKFTDSWMNSNS